MKISEIIKKTRRLAGESQSIFGRRFSSTKGAVSLWESGNREAPYEVIEFCLEAVNFTQSIKGRLDQTIKALKELRSTI